MRNIAELKLRDGRPISIDLIAKTESIIGFSLPESFRTLVRENNASSPEVGAFDYENDTTCVSEFLGCDPDDPTGIVSSIRRLRNLPAGIVPFARDPGDWLICFDYRDGVKPEIVMYVPETGRLVEIATAFEQFVDALYS